MRTILYIIIIGVLLFIPLERLDVAKLEPVEAVAVYLEKGEVVLETDTESVGKGETIQQALENLKKNTPAIIYLDTAEYLLVAESAREHAEQLMEYLKKNVKTGKYAGGDVREEAKYMDAHVESALPKKS